MKTGSVVADLQNIPASAEVYVKAGGTWFRVTEVERLEEGGVVVAQIVAEPAMWPLFREGKS